MSRYLPFEIVKRPGTKRAARNVPYNLLATVISIAVALSVFSYVYFLSASSQIDNIVRDDLRRQNKADALHVSEALTSELRVVVTNTFTAADAPLIRIGDVERGKQPLNSRQEATDYLTDRYLWIDENGKTLWSTAFVNITEYDLYKGFDVSSRPYFAIPARTHEPYFSPVVQSPIDKSQRMFISYPIFAEPQTQPDVTGKNLPIFKGVIVGSIRADKLYEVIKSKLSTDMQSSAGIVDPNGIIVYSTVSSIIGESIFGDEVQSIFSQTFPSDKVTEFKDFLKRSIEGQVASKDVSGSQGQASSITSLPVTLQYSIINVGDTNNAEPRIQTREVRFLTFYLITPHDIAGKIGPLIDQQRNLTTGIIAAIGAITVVISYVLIAWNKKLQKTVEDRTTSLNDANKSLSRTIEELAGKSKELEQANENLKVHDRLQKEFVNIAAHELRTPIQPLLGAAELIESQFQEKNKIEVTRAEIEMILRNARRLERLSSDILEMSRAESGALKLNKEEFSLAYIIADAVRDAKTQSFFDADKVAITYYPDDMFVHADREKITQVVTNLLTNAIKFTNEGTISVTTRRDNENGTVQITIKDTGTGIDPEVLPQLFNKFVTKSDKGTGIGLYISKKIIEAHGGTILGKNNLSGRGASFVFTLPLAGDLGTKQEDTRLSTQTR